MFSLDALVLNQATYHRMHSHSDPEKSSSQGMGYEENIEKK
jgi:hypothetical protein